MRLDKLTKAAVDALEDIKGRDIVVLDVKKMTSLFDWIIIASADSARQGKALAGHLQEKMKALGARVVSVEGERTGEWVLVDLGSIVVHIMQPATRQYYNLEELWAPPPRAKRRRTGDAAR
jgi:ribosome-associated protein